MSRFALICCDVCQIPNYYKMIMCPMDLSTVRSRLSKSHFNHYQTVEEFVSDLQLIFTNCDTFNPVRSRRQTYSVVAR